MILQKEYPMPTATRSYSAENFLLELDGVKCGFLKSVDGGGISADVVQEQAGNNYFARKHIAQVKYEDLSLQMDLSLDKSIYDWIASSWSGSYSRKDIDVFVAGSAMEFKSQREFFNALISETTIPAMDASSKEPCYLTLKISPEYSRSKKASGKLNGKVSKGGQKHWLASNFKLQVDGLDCAYVSKVDAFSVKQTITTAAVGEMRDYQKLPGRIEYPNLKVTLPESHAQSWIDWHEDFVIKGNCGDSQEKSGSLTFLAPNLKERAHINFFNLGIFRLAPEKRQEPTDQISRIVAELYCERMEFVFLGAS
jgi:phage tail-like protein